MRGTTAVLALVGGGFLGALVGVPAGCCIGYYALREPPPTHSNMQNPGDWMGAIGDAGDRSQVAAHNAFHAVAGAAVGGGLGAMAGVGLAVWAGRRTPGTEPAGPGHPGAD
jgi:hypothetical protein